MANYYVSRDGKVSKDKKTKQTASYRVSVDGKVTKVKQTTKKKKKKEEDIAPVKKTTGGNKNSWFKSGGFSDGVDGVGDFFGDLAQTTVGTIGDIGVGVGKGITRLGEGVVDLGTYGVAKVADLAGKDKWAEKTKKKAQKDWTSKAWKKAENAVDKYSVLGNKADNVTEGLGTVAGILATGGLAGYLGAGGAVATGITTGVTGLSGMGSGMSEAYQNKATDKEAFTYGAITGTAEAATELLFGGLGKTVKALGVSKGLSSADDMLAKKITSKFTNQIAKNFTEYGIKAGAEGTEEVLSGIAQAWGKNVTYMEEKDLRELIKDEKLLDQFIVGSITSGIAQSGYVPGMKQGSLREANKSGTDFITGLTQNEQKVVDKEYENRITEAEEGGKTLSKKEKNKIYDEVINDLEKGYISTDTIEGALGGETYKTYKSMEERENEVRKEIEELEKTPYNQFTVKQHEKLTSLREQLATMEKSGLKNKVRNQLNSEVSELAMASKLSESYNEKTRRGEAFQADLTKYDAKQQDVIKKATESGILNNTNRTHEFVDMVAKISADKGVSFDFTNNQKLKDSGFAVEGKTVNGYVKDGNIAVNIDSNKSLNSVVGHEITHVLEGTELYTELQNAVKEYATTKGEYDTRFNELSEIYKDVEGSNIESELTADLVGDYLFTDSDFISNLSTKKPNIFQRIYDEIKYLCKIATAGSKEARQLEKVKRAFDKAYKESASNNADTNTDTKHSLSENKNIKNEVNDFSNGEMFATMSYTQDGEVVGTLKYSEYNGEPSVKMVEVAPEYRRKGIATKLLQELQKKYPDAEINFGMTTEDGTKLLESITYNVTDKAVATDRQKLENLQTELNKLQESLDFLYDIETLTDEQETELQKLGDRWNEVYDTIRELEVELRDKKATKTFVKTDEDIHFSLSEDEKARLNKVTDDGLTMTYVRNPNSGASKYNYGSTYGQNIEPAGEYMNMDESQGKYKNEGWEYGTIRFKKPLVLEHINTSDTGWKKTVSDMYGGKTGKALTQALIKDGYDAIVTYDNYGYNEIVNLNGEKLNDSEKTKNLQSDSNGKTLTKEQQEYFKDSKVRDKNGNLKVMYHGTPNGDYTVFRDGTYFTENKDYADRYQSPSASSISTGKVASNPKTFEVYLNIKKPFDISDPEARDIYINEYIKGGNAMGINPYMSDSEYAKIDTIDWTEGEDLREFLIDNEYDYDGLILDEGADGGYGDEVSYRGKSYVVFNPEQIKNIDNTKPTDNPDINLSMSNKGQNIAPYGNYNVYGKDVALEQDIAPTVPRVQIQTDAAQYNLTQGEEQQTSTLEDTVTPVQEPIQEPIQEHIENIAPLTEEQANVRDEEQSLASMPAEEFEKLVQSYINSDEVPPFLFDDDEIRAWAEEEARQNSQGITQKEELVIPESPLDKERDIFTIGKERKTNAYMYENPEVKRYFQDEAQVMLWELNNSTKGERARQGTMYGLNEYEIGASNEGWYGTKRQTSEEIAYLLDTFNYTYNDIEKGLKAIIEDHGAENNAVSKRIEFLLDDRLRKGYTVFTSGFKMPPNEDYINLLNKKQVTEYNDEARSKYFQPEVATVDTIAETTETVEDIAPIKEIAAEPVTTINKNIPVQTDEKQVTSKLDAGKPPIGDGAKQRKWIKTSTESKPVDKKILPKDLDQKAITYEPIPNKNTLNNANSMLKRNGYDESVKYFNSQFQNKKISLDDIALGERLIQEAVKKGDMETAGELIQNVSILGTELGQKVQALSIIQRLTPEGQLKTLTKIVERGKAKGDKTFEGVEITQEMIDKVLKTYHKDGTYSQEELDRAVEEVKQQIADQMKVTKMDKINAWRYLSMLGNPKTHVRNIISNVGMKGTMAVKDAIARSIETVAPIETRTKTWKKTSNDVKEFAKQTTKEMQSILEDGGKYSDTNDIKSKRQIFKNKVLNAVFEFNNDMLSKEDWWFQGAAFNKAFSEYLTANGISTKEDIQNNAELIEKAKAYATEQSEIATFKQYSYIAHKLNEIESKNTATQIGVGAIVPFKKTPVNIAKTGLNYSPLGFMKTLTYDASQVKKGNMEASQMIDHLAQNMTGTGLALAGYMLAMSGFLNGAGEEDKEGKYDYQLGKQSYSVNIGGNTYSLSWLTPMAMPLFVGANAFETLTEGKEWDGNVVIESLTQTLDPMSEMSVLSGLTNVLSSYEKGSGIWADIAQTASQNYVTQFVPTLSGQVATLMDDKQRSTKVAGNSDFKFLEETVNKLKSKIPVLRETLEPSTDVWGREVKLNENKWQKTFDTFLAPYSRKENIATQIDEELKDLYSDTGDGGLFPQTPKNSVNYEGEKYNMSAKEYTSYKKTYGQNALDLMEELFRTTTYQNASSSDKAEMVDKVYDYANDEAKRKYLAKKDIEFTNAKKDGEPYYKENIIKGAIENDMPLMEFDFYNEYPEKYNFLQKNNVSYKEYSKDEDTREAYNWAFNNQEKYTVSKVISDDLVAYKKLTQEIYKFRADKDSNGKTINGTAKAKKINYINNLDMEYGKKLVLFKSLFDKDDTYNYEIIDYLNSREDITYEETETILKQLGFTVAANGNIYWD